MQVPKLDGLACSFILGTPDSLDYNVLYQSLIDLLQVFQRSSSVDGTKDKPKIEKNLVAEVRVDLFLHLFRLYKCLISPTDDVCHSVLHRQHVEDSAVAASLCRLLGEAGLPGRRHAPVIHASLTRPSSKTCMQQQRSTRTIQAWATSFGATRTERTAS